MPPSPTGSASRMSPIATVCPARASASAIPRPIPRLPPLTNATLPMRRRLTRRLLLAVPGIPIGEATAARSLLSCHRSISPTSRRSSCFSRAVRFWRPALGLAHQLDRAAPRLRIDAREVAARGGERLRHGESPQRAVRRAALCAARSTFRLCRGCSAMLEPPTRAYASANRRVSSVRHPLEPRQRRRRAAAPGVSISTRPSSSRATSRTTLRVGGRRLQRLRARVGAERAQPDLQRHRPSPVAPALQALAQPRRRAGRASRASRRGRRRPPRTSSRSSRTCARAPSATCRLSMPRARSRSSAPSRARPERLVRRSVARSATVRMPARRSRSERLRPHARDQRRRPVADRLQHPLRRQHEEPVRLVEVGRDLREQLVGRQPDRAHEAGLLLDPVLHAPALALRELRVAQVEIGLVQPHDLDSRAPPPAGSPSPGATTPRSAPCRAAAAPSAGSAGAR